MITLNVNELYSAMRLGIETNTVGPDETKLIERLKAMADAKIKVYAPKAPQDMINQAAIMFITYVHDTERESSVKNPFVASGARSILSPWHEYIAVPISEE